MTTLLTVCIISGVLAFSATFFWARLLLNRAEQADQSPTVDADLARPARTLADATR